MICPLLAKLYGNITKKKISNCLDDNNLRAKGQANFRNKHSTSNIFTFWIIAQSAKMIKKMYSLYLWIFYIVPRGKLLKCMDDLEIPYKLGFVVYMLCEQIITKLKTSQGWSKEINCNIGV